MSKLLVDVTDVFEETSMEKETVMILLGNVVNHKVRPTRYNLSKKRKVMVRKLPLPPREEGDHNFLLYNLSSSLSENRFAFAVC